MDEHERDLGMYLLGVVIILGFVIIVILMRQKETHFIRDSQGNIISIIER